VTALERLSGTITIANDILVFGKGDTHEQAERDHDKNIIALLEKDPKTFALTQRNYNLSRLQ